MSTLYFYNPGIIDINGATIAGLSAKEGKNPIGLFGTGLKYSIACILRWGGRITIRAGNDVYSFGASDLNFRGKEFQQVVMNGTPLGFTTEYGKKWVAWQVFRELYANALDEGGGVLLGALPLHEQFDTVIEVDCKPLADLYHERDTIILPPTKHFSHSCPLGSVTAGASRHQYYRGVRVADIATILTWNITATMDLTEDRTLKYAYYYSTMAGNIIMQCKDKNLITLVLKAPQSSFEGDIEIGAWQEYSPEFLEVAVALYKQAPSRHHRLKEFLKQNNPESVLVRVLELSPLRRSMLDRAKSLVARMGFPEIASQDIIVADLGSDTLGQFKDGQIYLDPKVFDQGTKQVVSTLYEEAMHQATGYSDCTYQMQTHLFNIITSLYEEHVFGEAM